MAESFPLDDLPDSLVITLADTDAVELRIKDGSHGLHLYFVATAGTIAFTGTDGAAQDSNAVIVPADAWHWFPVRGGLCYIAGDAAAKVHAMVVEE